jgi:hypothetical protein
MYVDTRSAAAIYDISESTLAKWRLKGCGPPYLKRGRWLRYDTHKFDAWLLKHERISTSQQKPAEPTPSAVAPQGRKATKRDTTLSDKDGVKVAPQLPRQT